MKNFHFLGIIFFYLLSFSCKGQEQVDAVQAEFIQFYTNYNITNNEEPYFVEIKRLWENYLSSYDYMRNQDRWSIDKMPHPDFSYIQLGNELRQLRATAQSVQCNILGIVPVANNHYLIKSMFSQVHPETGQVKLGFIVSAYAKKVDKQFKLVNSSQYHMGIWEQHRVGEINYYVHPEHQFDKAQAEKMNQFNKDIAAKFEMEPKSYSYFVANNTTDLSQVLGYDFFFYSYSENRSGGMADPYNEILYAGNNSEYYPHEAVHLYTGEKFRRQFHTWVDEGVATLFGGSTGYVLDWHVQKLKLFLNENPDYELSDLKVLEKDVPNGEYTTDFRYVIGGYLMKLVYEKEGMQGLFECLSAGRSEDDYYTILKEKLGIERKDFGSFVKTEMLNLEQATADQMESYKY